MRRIDTSAQKIHAEFQDSSVPPASGKGNLLSLVADNVIQRSCDRVPGLTGREVERFTRDDPGRQCPTGLC